MWMKNPDPRIKPPLGSIIDWSHPLADGLVGCWLFNEGSGKVILDLCSRKINYLGSSPSWKSNSRGLYLDFQSGGTNGIAINQIELSAPFTLVIIARRSLDVWYYPLLGEEGNYKNYFSLNFKESYDSDFGLVLNDNHYQKYILDAYFGPPYSDLGNNTIFIGLTLANGLLNGYDIKGRIKQTVDAHAFSNLIINNIGNAYSSRPFTGLLSLLLIYIKDNSANMESLASLPYSFILWPSQTSIFDLAPGGSLIQRQAQAPVSWRRYYLKGAALNISSTIPAGRQAQAPVSYNKELSRLFSIPAAMLLTVSKEGTALFEAIEGVSREALFPVDWFSTTLVIAGKEIPISAVRYVSKMADAPLEGLVITEKARELSYSWLLSISRDAVIPTDWQGALLITKEAVLPVDFTRLLDKGGSMRLDWTRPLESPKGAVVEFLKMVQGAEAPFPLEVLSGLKEDIIASLDWIRSVLSEKDLGPTWLVFRSVDEEVCLSWVVPVEDEKDLDISWLKGIAKSAGLPVEVAGKAVRVEMLRFSPKIPHMRAVFRLKNSQIKLN